MKFLKVLLVFCLIAGVLFAGFSLLKGHNFNTEWTNDETHHWHSCSDEGCEEVSDKAEHTFGAVVTITGIVCGRHFGQTFDQRSGNSHGTTSLSVHLYKTK